MRLADAANVMTPAYLTLLAKGYSVRKHGDAMIAEGNGECFIAEDPLRLLGLVAVAQERGADWRASDQEVEAFLSQFG